MDVTRGNFVEMAPIIESSMKNCDFISIDTEFTGLDLPGDDPCSLFDSPSERYTKLKRAISAFTLAQVGIGCFKKDPSLNKYEAKIFNIYVFPASIGKLNWSFTCQISSIEFLCRSHFDFNKFIYEGVPFLDRQSVNRLRSDLEAGLVDHSEIGTSFFADTCDVLTEWLSKADIGQTTDVDVTSLGTGPKRWFFESELLRTFKDLHIQSGNNAKLVVEKCASGHENVLRERERQMLLQKIVDEYTGCSVLFNWLVNAKKPLVGQNLLMDLMYFYEKFYQPLPEKYDDFKKQMRNLLPEIYDARQIANSMQKCLEERGCKKFSLGSLYRHFELESATKHVVMFQPFIELAQDCKKYEKEQCPHEAGFDAYAVGVVFIRLAHTQAMQIISPGSPSNPLAYTDHIEAVKPFANRLNLIQASVAYINLTGYDPTSLRPDWLMITSDRFFKPIDRNQLVAYFSRYGTFDIRRVNRGKFLLAVASHSAAEAITKQYKNGKPYTVSSIRPSVNGAGLKRFVVNTALFGFGIGLCAWIYMKYNSGGSRIAVDVKKLS